MIITVLRQISRAVVDLSSKMDMVTRFLTSVTTMASAMDIHLLTGNSICPAYRIINHDSLGDYIDEVFVVFTCSRESEGRIVCGFYQHARVYAEPVNDNRSTRIIDTNGQSVFAEYNIVCNAENAILIDRNDRVKQLPHSTRNNGVGHGQSSIWYVDKPERQNLKNDLLDYVESIIRQGEAK